MGNIGWTGIIIIAIKRVLFSKVNLPYNGRPCQGYKSFKKGMSDENTQSDNTNNNSDNSNSENK